MPKKSKYLVCINEKSHSKTALFYACTKAKYSGSEVDMLYVIDPVDYNTIFSVADVIKKERLQNARTLFKELQEDALKWHGIKPKAIIREGLISEEITNYINKNPQIVMLILGVADDGSSNKERLLNKLISEIGNEFNLPLLIVPGNLTKEKILSLNICGT